MEQLQRAEQRLNIYRAGLFDEQGRPRGQVYRSIGLNFIRIRGYEGIPLEVLDSIIRLNDVLFGPQWGTTSWWTLRREAHRPAWSWPVNSSEALRISPWRKAMSFLAAFGSSSAGASVCCTASTGPVLCDPLSMP